MGNANTYGACLTGKPASYQQHVIPDTCVSFPLQTRALTVQNMDRQLRGCPRSLDAPQLGTFENDPRREGSQLIFGPKSVNAGLKVLKTNTKV